jgi:hypothetical protein
MTTEQTTLTAWADALKARRQPAIPPSTEPVLRGALEALAVLRERASVADAKRFLREVVAFGEAVGIRGAVAAAHSQAARLRVLAEDLLLDPTVLHGDRVAFEQALLAGLRRVFREERVPEGATTPAGLSGLLYWYLVYPLHTRIFAGMLRRIGDRSVQPAPTR